MIDARVQLRQIGPLLLARGCPALPLVIYHGAKPRTGDSADWLRAMQLLAVCPDVARKLSGLLTAMTPAAPLHVPLFANNAAHIQGREGWA
ncbi:amidohydrolase family protein, partial [Sphingobium sp.]|uniref:amidohydrolase family protein n=1 Tax=Sphingobium sp. TaxID=1912891 RepID=UPI0035C71B6E